MQLMENLRTLSFQHYWIIIVTVSECEKKRVTSKELDWCSLVSSLFSLSVDVEVHSCGFFCLFYVCIFVPTSIYICVYRAAVLTCASGHNLWKRDEKLHVNIFSIFCVVVNELTMTKISAAQQKYSPQELQEPSWLFYYTSCCIISKRARYWWFSFMVIFHVAFYIHI